MMLTRCPACQTVFRLHPDQLHARNGEVRCGHCFNPFNALQHQVGTPEDARTDADHHPQPPAGIFREPTIAVAAATLHPPAASNASDALDFELPEFPPFDAVPEPQTAPPIGAETRNTMTARPSAEGLVSTSAASAPREEMLPEPFGALDDKTTRDASETPAEATALPEVIRSGRRAGFDADEAGPASALEQPQSAEATPAPETPSTAEPADEAIPTLWANAADSAGSPEAKSAEARHVNLDHLDATYGRPRRKSSPLLRTLGGMAVGLLTGTLAVQSIYLFRTEIARELPGLRPALEAACASVHCEVPLPRDIALIGIETSDLQSEPGHPGRYVLHSSVRNRADYPQAWPHLELTLTDATETPVSRRTLPPSEWVPSAQLGPNFGARTTIPVRLPFDLAGASPTGYRVYIFFP